MSEFPKEKDLGRRERHRLNAVRAILSLLVERHGTTLVESMSSHYRPPEAPKEPLRYDQPPEGVGYTERPTMGFNYNGDYDVIFQRLNAPDDAE